MSGPAALLLAACIGAAAPNRFDGDRAEPAPDRTLDERAFAIASDALAWLATQQNQDGSFSVEQGGRDEMEAPVAVTALSALAFMAGGSTMGRGPHRDQVRNAIDFLIKNTRDWTLPSSVPGAAPSEGLYISLVSDSNSKMHGHGYATLALAQAYGTYRIDPSYGEEWTKQARDELAKIRVALAGAVDLIIASQTQAGGWYYEPGDMDHEGSVTITQIQALRAARDVGISVSKKHIDDAVAYVHKSQNAESGGFQYSLNNKQQVTYALTAAAIATLNATGDYDSSVIDRGIAYMEQRDPLFSPDGRYSGRDNHPYYARLYAAQAYYVYRDSEYWRRWYPLIVDEYGGDQLSSGAIGSGDYGRVYTTASACLVLLMPQQYLPIFQK